MLTIMPLILATIGQYQQVCTRNGCFYYLPQTVAQAAPQNLPCTKAADTWIRSSNGNTYLGHLDYRTDGSSYIHFDPAKQFGTATGKPLPPDYNDVHRQKATDGVKEERKHEQAASATDWRVNGLARDRLFQNGNTERYSFSTSSPKAREEAKAFLAPEAKPAEADPDPKKRWDSGKLYVTVVGTDEERDPIIRDLQSNPLLTRFKDDILVKALDTKAWPTEYGIPTTGKPSTLIEDNTGTSLYQFEDYKGGPKELAKQIEAGLHKVNPSYDPKLVPGMSSGACPFGFTRDHRPLVAATAAVVMLLLYRRKVSLQ